MHSDRSVPELNESQTKRRVRLTKCDQLFFITEPLLLKDAEAVARTMQYSLDLTAFKITLENV